ncbi:MAG TPA: hypothetical protein VNM68_00080 [Candidatus Polarisedimenticolia bacterium]|nr:hypothetical protein [Candidatus Polarisedimenticolia bacterium]
MHRKISVLLFAVAIFALPSVAQNSKLNGTWKLNVSKSDFGQFPPPAGETDVITINGTDFKQHVTSESSRGTSQYTRACTIDGKETVLSPDNPNAHIGPVLLDKIQCGWDGGSLVVTEGAKMQGSDLTDKLTFSVSDDGNAMTLTSHITSAMMNADRKMVYDRTEASAAASPAAGGASASAAAAASAGPHPNLSGTWKLDIAKSDFGAGQPPASQVDTIEMNGVSCKVTTDQKGGFMGDTTYAESFTTDGKESTWSGMGGSEVKGTAQWEGNTLVVNAKTSFQGSDVTIKDTYTLGEDGKTLHVTSHAGTSMGDFDSKMVFDKQ